MTQSAPTPPPTGGLSDVTVGARRIELWIYDHAVDDGDLVAVYVNGRPISDRVEIANAGTSLPVTLNIGQNSLGIEALNEGALSPNTAGLRISDVIEGAQDQMWALTTGALGSMTITCAPGQRPSSGAPNSRGRTR